ncbi:hypothetical protein CF642_39345 [Burkholderia pseudomallei]|nr:hypothetical protein CF642_39345 [Burkholderia pseudomallei]
MWRLVVAGATTLVTGRPLRLCVVERRRLRMLLLLRSFATVCGGVTVCNRCTLLVVLGRLAGRSDVTSV